MPEPEFEHWAYMDPNSPPANDSYNTWYWSNNHWHNSSANYDPRDLFPETPLPTPAPSASFSQIMDEIGAAAARLQFTFTTAASTNGIFVEEPEYEPWMGPVSVRQATYRDEWETDQPVTYRDTWMDRVERTVYSSVYRWMDDPNGLDRPGNQNGTVRMVRAIRDEAYALNVLYNEAHYIGTTNTEGGNMPEPEVAEVAIPASQYVRSEIFARLRLEHTLTSQLDDQTWQEALNTLREGTKDSIHRVLIGSYDVGSPRVPVGGRNVNVDAVPLETARALVLAASRGRVTLAHNEEESRYGSIFVELEVINPLEQAGWKNYHSRGLYVTEEEVNLRDLKSVMEHYRVYRAEYRRQYVRDAMRAQLSVAEQVPRTEQFTTARADNLARFISKVKASTKHEYDPFKKMAILPHETRSSRRWGIEIEAVDIAGIETPEYWDLHDDGSLRPVETDSSGDSPNHDDSCGVHDIDDGFCDCGASDGDWEYSKTGEWNSPILRSFHSRGLKYLTDQLQNRDSNTTPGVHVHVEASDLTPEQAVRLSVIYSALEPLFESEYQRETREYCKSVDVAELINRFNVMRNVRGYGGQARDMEFYSRYWTVNLAALQQHGTIEFRAMGPRYNYEHLIRWAHFCREMVNIAKADVPQKAWSKVKTFEDLIVLFSKYGKETPTPEWAPNTPAKDIVAAIGKEKRMIPNEVRHADGVTDVFEDYYVKETKLRPASYASRW